MILKLEIFLQLSALDFIHCFTTTYKELVRNSLLDPLCIRKVITKVGAECRKDTQGCWTKKKNSLLKFQFVFVVS